MSGDRDSDNDSFINDGSIEQEELSESEAGSIASDSNTFEASSSSDVEWSENSQEGKVIAEEEKRVARDLEQWTSIEQTSAADFNPEEAVANRVILKKCLNQLDRNLSMDPNEDPNIDMSKTNQALLQSVSQIPPPPPPPGANANPPPALLQSVNQIPPHPGAVVNNPTVTSPPPTQSSPPAVVESEVFKKPKRAYKKRAKKNDKAETTTSTTPASSTPVSTGTSAPVVTPAPSGPPAPPAPSAPPTTQSTLDGWVTYSTSNPSSSNTRAKKRKG